MNPLHILAQVPAIDLLVGLVVVAFVLVVLIEIRDMRDEKAYQLRLQKEDEELFDKVERYRNDIDLGC